MDNSSFSDTYSKARNRFKEAAAAIGADLASYALDADPADQLTIDVAMLGAEAAPTVLLSSGIHGVEGFLGSAVQLAFLERLKQARSRTDFRYVLIHGLNPYGFANLRRVNEDNVDLNRNFRDDFAQLPRPPEGYAILDPLLNPPSPPPRWELIKLKLLWHILRRGLPALRQAIAGGQYGYPHGLFFGGQAPCQSTRIVREHREEWLGSAEDILHIDFHTGLGKFGTYKMLTTESADSDEHKWHTKTFGSEYVEVLAPPALHPENVAFQASGIFGEWMQKSFRDRTYHFTAAEFGTYPGMPMLQALRTENRAHHYCSEGDPRRRRAKEELLECFCPKSPTWRNTVVDSSLKIIAQGEEGLRRN